MKSRLLLSFAVALFLACATSSMAQETKTTMVQNSDGTWTVIEYPIDKEVIVDLTPTTAIAGALGTARVKRVNDRTMINLDLKGFSSDVTNLNLYAVDPTGRTTLLAPVMLNNGMAQISTMTPLNRFMLVLSPDANLSTIGADTKVLFRSAVPEGFAVLPLSSSGERDGAAVGERVSATSTTGSTSGYAAPLLGIPSFRRGTDTEMKINFAGALTGSRANVYLEPRKDGPTTIKIRFHELKDAPAGQAYIVWVVSPDNKFQRLGQIINTGRRNEAQIQSETAFTDFGLFVTTEQESAAPTGTIVGTVIK